MSTFIRLLVSLVALLSVAGVLLVTSGSASAQEEVRISVGDRWFCDSSNQDGVCITEINAGDTVVWDSSGSILPTHTATNCGETCETSDGTLFNSGTLNPTFAFTFNEAGEYPYRCNIYPDEMRGVIVVTGVAPATATPEDAKDDDDGDDDTPPAATATPVEDDDRAPPEDDDDAAAPDEDDDTAPEAVALPSTGTGTGSSSAISAWYLAGLAMTGLLLVSGGLALVGARKRLS